MRGVARQLRRHLVDARRGELVPVDRRVVVQAGGAVRVGDGLLAMLRCSTDKNQSTIDKCAAYARLSPPYEAPLSGEGQLGVFEGLTSDISVRDTRSFSALTPPWRWLMVRG